LSVDASDMSANQPQDVLLRDHDLDHLPELWLGIELLTTRFARSCSTSACSARCCRAGVLVDISHRDRVLEEAAVVVQYMEESQVRDPSRWFEAEDEPDTDFPSGRAVNTSVVNDTCVFLDSQRRCVLHLAEATSPGLKPFVCRAYPITITNARLTLEADWCPEETQCCGPVDGGELTMFDFCEPELVHMLGSAGMAELRRVASDSERRVTSA
jgi:Fe-S-cluster containining protein